MFQWISIFLLGYFYWLLISVLDILFGHHLTCCAVVYWKTASSWPLYFCSFFWIYPHIVSFLSSEYLHIDINPYCNTFQYHSEVHQHAIILIAFAGVLAQICSADSAGERQFKRAQWVLTVTLQFLSSAY